jgi:hypothetical protein
VSGAGEVRVQLTGSPARDADYLIVYSAAAQPVVPLQADTDGFSTCAPAGA